MSELSEGGKALGDVVSISALLGVLISALPDVATALTVLWMVLRIYETDTVQRLLGKRKDVP